MEGLALVVEAVLAVSRDSTVIPQTGSRTAAAACAMMMRRGRWSCSGMAAAAGALRCAAARPRCPAHRSLRP